VTYPRFLGTLAIGGVVDLLTDLEDFAEKQKRERMAMNGSATSYLQEVKALMDDKLIENEQKNKKGLFDF
jgi:hypothetical protein